MGKHPGATPEELEFIFEQFITGLDDVETLKEMDDTSFPLRRRRFIRDRRLNFNAAKKVLENHGLVAGKQPNWIEDYEAKHGELPPIPDWMVPLVEDYSPATQVHKPISPGAKVSKTLGLIPPSAYFWKQKLKPSEREQVLQLAEWLGQDRRDYMAWVEKHWPHWDPLPIATWEPPKQR